MRARPWDALALLAVGLLTMTGGDGGCGCDSSTQPDCEGTASITAPADQACILVNTPVDFSAILVGGASTFQSWTFSEGAGLDQVVNENPTTVTFTGTGDFTVTYSTSFLGPSCSEGHASAQITVRVRDDCTTPPAGIALGVHASPVANPDGVNVFSKTNWAGISLSYAFTLSGAEGSVVVDPYTNTVVHPFLASAPAYGSVALQGPLKRSGGTVATDGLVEFGSTGGTLHLWDDQGQDWFGFSQAIVFSTSALDANPYAETRGGLTVATPGYIRTIEWDDVNGFTSIGSDLFSSDFPGIPGGFVSSQARAQAGPLLVLSDGSPGQLFLHDRTPGNAGTSLGAVGMTPRRVRMAGGIFAVTAQGSDSLFVGTWDVSDNVALTDGAAVGDGPVGVDLVDLENGNVAAVTTGFNDNTYTVTVIDGTTGAVVSSTTTAAPAGIVNPAHASFLDTDHKIIITGYGSDNYAVVASGL